MKVKELRKALRGLDGELEVIVRTESDEPGSAYVGTIGSASYQYGCDGVPFRDLLLSMARSVRTLTLEAAS